MCNWKLISLSEISDISDIFKYLTAHNIKMKDNFEEETWDGKDCSICGNDCWKNRMKLAIEIAKEFKRDFSMRELYNELAKRHPPARKTEKRKTPWATFYRDIYKDPNFVKVDRGVFRLVDNPQICNTSKNKKHNELVQFEISVKKLQLLKEAKMITEEEYMKKGKELLNLIKLEENMKGDEQRTDTLRINMTKENDSFMNDSFKSITKDESKQKKNRLGTNS